MIPSDDGIDPANYLEREPWDRPYGPGWSGAARCADTAENRLHGRGAA
jgi:hypothetical protein